jgi:hypothetical protein
MTTDTPLNLNKPTMDIADIRLKSAPSITVSTFAKELQEDSLRAHLDELREKLAASKAEVERLKADLYRAIQIAEET